jgi:DNA-binding CsgD family transcriptional regulator
MLPPADDPAIATILEGLRRLTGAAGGAIEIELLPKGPRATYRCGEPCDSGTLVIELEPRESYHARCLVCGAGGGPGASPATMGTLAPVLQGAIDALLERYNSHRQVEVLAQILGAAEEAMLLVDAAGEIVYANEKGDELLAWHTEEPLARMGNGATPAPLLHLVAGEVEDLRRDRQSSRRRTLTLADESSWELEIIALSRSEAGGYCLLLLSPIKIPGPGELHERLSRHGVSRREAEVIAQVLRGQRTCDVAEALGITEYTVKDHLKHVFAKLRVASRAELFARLAGEGAIPAQN